MLAVCKSFGRGQILSARLQMHLIPSVKSKNCVRPRVNQGLPICVNYG
jgi:hypothetical protein